MKRNMKNIIFVLALGSLALQGCSLDENNPGGFTLENIATSAEGYETLLNNCYFGLERHYYGSAGTGSIDEGYMNFTEASTDLWTYKTNKEGSYNHIYWMYAGASPNTTYTNNMWNSAYDGIGACNLAIESVPMCTELTTAQRNSKLAEARFLRAVYYYNIVEMFGSVYKSMAVESAVNYEPTRTQPLEIYRDIIIPDLEFAFEHLAVGTDATLIPTKKSALAFLAKACLQSKQYTDEFLQKGLDAAKKLITDCESGGATYNTFMYPNYEDVFKEANNMTNKEALWKYNLYADSNNYGSSNGNYRLNRNHEYFTCQLSTFGAREDNQASKLSGDAGGYNGILMPTQHLLSLFVQGDGTLDPRFHTIFTTQWKANKEYKWTESDVKHYGKEAAMVDRKIEKDATAIKFVMPQDADYAAEVAGKTTSNYLLVDYKDVYDDAKRNIIMQRNGGENMFCYFYPSLKKHNSTRFYVANASKQRNGNLNAMLIMRMPEIYLIAAELDIYLNGGSNAMAYINKVRSRAGAKVLNEAPNLRTVIDERGRELCGEYSRYFDLKRTGMFKDNSYLQETHPDLAKYFKPEYALRPISTTYIATITNGEVWQNPGF